MARGLTIIAALIGLLFLATGAHAEDGASDATGRRIALVVGNSSYSIPQLVLGNPKNDAEDVGAALKALGFEVITATDLSLNAFDASVREFKDKAKGAEVALFFYAGHAVQSDHVNYFIPVDADITQESQLKRLAVNIGDIQDALSGVQGVQVMILDSCRDNPFSSLKIATRGIDGATTRGLERIVVSSGDSIVLYSTRANDVASDGAPGARNSPFSRVLIDVLKRPGRHELQDILKEVASKVRRESDGKQSPELITSLSGDYEFNLINDRLEWEAIKTSLDPKAFRNYAARFPLSAFRKQAEIYAGRLEEQQRLRRDEAQKRGKDVDQAQQTKGQADRAEKVCWDNYQRLDLLKAGGDQGGLEKLQRENSCPKLQAAIDAAVTTVTASKQKATCDRLEGELNDFGQAKNASGLAAIQPEAAPCPGLADRIAQALTDLQTAERQRKDAEEQARLAQERQKAADEAQREVARQQALCDADAAQLKTLVSAKGPHRTDDVAALAISAHCDAVKADAQATAEDFRRQDAQAEHDAKQRVACAAETRKMQDALASGPRSTLDTLVRSHVCETLDAAGALAQFDDRAEKRRQQAICDDEGARLKSLATGAPNARRTSGIADLGTAAQCPSVKNQALALADDLRRQEAQAVHDAQQRLACAAEAKTVRDAINGSARAPIEALDQAHTCETLDVAGALAQYDDTMEKRRQEALKTCAAVDVAGLGDRQDDRALADLMVKCPSRASDIAAVQKAIGDKRQLAEACRNEGDQLQRLVEAHRLGGVDDLRKRATCPTLDIPGAIAAISTFNCAQGLRTVGALRDDDEAALRNSAGNADLCPDARTAAQQRLDQLASNRRDDATCDQKVTEATGRNDVDALTSLATQDVCARRRTVVASALDMQRKTAEQARVLAEQQRLADAACQRGVALVDRQVEGDQDALRRLANDAGLCQRAKQLAVARLARIETARGDDASCDKAVANAVARGDVDQLKGLQGQAGCVRRGDVIARAIDEQTRKSDQARIAQASCDKGLADVAAVQADDEAALHRFADDPGFCPTVRSAAGTRLVQIASARDTADRACDKAVAAASSANDVEAITQLNADPNCVRRQNAITKAVAVATQGRTRVAQVQLAKIGCYVGQPTGTVDDATRQAVTLYRTTKLEGGPDPDVYNADFVKELSGQGAKVCLQEASLPPADDTPPAASDTPSVPGPTDQPPAVKPVIRHRPRVAPAPEVEQPPPPRPRKRIAVPEPRYQPEPQPRSRPPRREYAEPAPRARPAPAPRAAPAAPSETGQAKPQGAHIFY